MYTIGCFVMLFAVIFCYYYDDSDNLKGMDDGGLFFTCAMLVFLWPITIPSIIIFVLAKKLAEHFKK